MKEIQEGILDPPKLSKKKNRIKTLQKIVKDLSLQIAGIIYSLENTQNTSKRSQLIKQLHALLFSSSKYANVLVKEEKKKIKLTIKTPK